MEDRTVAVEQLERVDDAALHQHSRDHCSCCPPSCAYWHLEEPLFQRHLPQRAIAAPQHSRHLSCRVPVAIVLIIERTVAVRVSEVVAIVSFVKLEVLVSRRCTAVAEDKCSYVD